MKSGPYHTLYTRSHSPVCLVTANLKALFLSVVVATMLMSCGTAAGPDKPPPSPELQGLEGTEINKIKPSPRMPSGLVLATEIGVFVYEDNRFKRIGLEDKDVVDIVLTGEQEMLAGIRTPQVVEGETTLFKTSDGGKAWQPFMGNYGGEDGPYTWVAALAVHPEDSQHLFARGMANVSQSVDGGQTWESVFLTWGHFGSNASLLTIDPNNPDIIWAGGSTAIFTPDLFKSEDGGESWVELGKKLQIFEDFVFGSTAYSVAIKPGRSSDVLLGLGIGIFRSTDGGESWESIFSDASAQVITHSARNPETVYASGRNASGTLFFVQSDDFGDTWETIEIEMEDAPADIRVNDMISVMLDGRELLYFGTNQGLFSYVFE